MKFFSEYIHFLCAFFHNNSHLKSHPTSATSMSPHNLAELRNLPHRMRGIYQPPNFFGITTLPIFELLAHRT